MSTVKLVGFWYNEEDCNKDFPMPVPRDPHALSEIERKEHSIFVHQLKSIEGILMTDHLKNDHGGQFVAAYRGRSQCRLCNNSAGSYEFVMGDGDGNQYHWPEGYMHYLTVHFVQPDPEFKQFIESLHGTLIGCCYLLQDYEPDEGFR